MPGKTEPEEPQEDEIRVDRFVWEPGDLEVIDGPEGEEPVDDEEDPSGDDDATGMVGKGVEFDESKHPRDDRGRFGSGESSTRDIESDDEESQHALSSKANAASDVAGAAFGTPDERDANLAASDLHTKAGDAHAKLNNEDLAYEHYELARRHQENASAASQPRASKVERRQEAG